MQARLTSFLIREFGGEPGDKDEVTILFVRGSRSKPMSPHQSFLSLVAPRIKVHQRRHGIALRELAFNAYEILPEPRV